jgi:cyclase
VALRLPRIIPRLDIKGTNVVKGIHLEGLRVVGQPGELARRYACDADELLYIDTVASLYGRNQLTELLRSATADVFIPITVGGGVKTRADFKRLLDAGADKVAVNTAALRNPSLLREASEYYGSQAVVLSISARRQQEGWEALTDAGREKTGRSAVEWAIEAVALGAGEILLTSVDQEGTRRGFDIDLLKAVQGAVGVPVVICGGLGKPADLLAAAPYAHGIAGASVFHYGQMTVADCRRALGQDAVEECPRLLETGLATVEPAKTSSHAVGAGSR